jgi:flagellar hook protein FlgE
MASFSIPLTGLKADSTALNTVANDLSNMNTTAFKAQTTNFSDLFYQQIGSTGSGDPIQVGAGVRVASNETDFTQGSISSTGNSTDVALDGNGFFVVSNGSQVYEYTRDGNFTLDSTGGLVTANGMTVMGYPAIAGVVNTNAPLTKISIPVGQVQQQATTDMSLTANLDSNSAAMTQFPAQVTVYDSLGAKTVGTVAGDVSSIALNFNPAGTNVLADGAAGLNIQWNLLSSAGTPTISQVATASALTGTSQNGYPSGQYNGFSIGADGTVTVSYLNGQQENVGQLALANVANLQGLALLGNGDYGTTLASGAAAVGTSGTAGLATMQDSALEAANVNISTEFAELIVAQRAFEANAKSVTTFDTVTQDTINMVH